MARGVADVLALYLDRAKPPAPLRSPTPERESLRRRGLWAPHADDSVIESFLIWNLNRGLSRSGRALWLRAAREPGDDAALLLLHSSRRGVERAESRLGPLEAGLRVEVVVYGERAVGESGTWTRRLAERVPRHRAALVHLGGLDTGHTLARSIVRREAIVERATDPAARQHWLSLCAHLGQTNTPECSTAG